MTSVAPREPRACWEHPVCTASVTADLPLWAGVLSGPCGEDIYTHTHTHTHINTELSPSCLTTACVSSTGSLARIGHASRNVWRASTFATKLNVMQSILSMLRCQGYRGRAAHVLRPCGKCEPHHDSSGENDYHS